MREKNAGPKTKESVSPHKIPCVMILKSIIPFLLRDVAQTPAKIRRKIHP